MRQTLKTLWYPFAPRLRSTNAVVALSRFFAFTRHVREKNRRDGFQPWLKETLAPRTVPLILFMAGLLLRGSLFGDRSLDIVGHRGCRE